MIGVASFPFPDLSFHLAISVLVLVGFPAASTIVLASIASSQRDGVIPAGEGEAIVLTSPFPSIKGKGEVVIRNMFSP